MAEVDAPAVAKTLESKSEECQYFCASVEKPHTIGIRGGRWAESVHAKQFPRPFDMLNGEAKLWQSRNVGAGQVGRQSRCCNES